MIEKATTLIVRLLVIGRFSKKWDYDEYLPNLPNWSQVASSNNSSEMTFLLNSHHTNIACSRPLKSLGRDILAKRANWDSSFHINGEISYISF